LKIVGLGLHEKEHADPYGQDGWQETGFGFD